MLHRLRLLRDMRDQEKFRNVISFESLEVRRQPILIAEGPTGPTLQAGR